MKITLRLAGLVMACLAPGYCLGESTKELEDLVVTASLEPIARDQVAASLTILTREDIVQRQAIFLSDLLRTVPGFAVSQSGGPGAQTQVRVRGAEANHVLVLVDGMRVNDPASAGEFQFQYALGEDVERIEILRGPQSAIWGTDALSAVVNIIRRNSDSQAGLRAGLETGSWNSRKANFGGHHGNARYSAWFGLSGFESDGINIARTGDERDGSRTTSADLGIELPLGEWMSFSLSGQNIQANTEFDEIDFFVTGLPVDADRLTRADRTYLHASLELAPLKSSWHATIQAHSLKTENRNFHDGGWNSSTAAETFEIKAKASLLLGRQGAGERRLTLAMDQSEVDFSQRGIASFFGDPNQDQSFDKTGLAAEFFSSAAESWSWTVSARNDDFSDFRNATTWQLAAGWVLNEQWRLRGSIGTGSKAPTFDERYGFFEGSFIGNPDLKPEQSRGWELGFQAELAEGDIQLDFAWFDRRLEDEIDGFAFDPASGMFTAENRAVPSDREGFEFTLDAMVHQRLSLGINFSHVDSTEPDFAGEPVPEVRRPENMASLVANYRFGDDRGNLNLEISRNGSRHDLFFSPQTFLSERVVLSAYTLVDVAASWRLGKSMELTARVDNLLDEDYEEVLGFRRPGRSLFMGVRGQFSTR